MVQASGLNKAIVAMCAVGFGLCYYAYFVESQHDEDKSYQPICDISERMSCTKAFSSPYGRGFGLVRHILGEDSPLNVPNSVPGMALYPVFAGLCLVQSAWSARVQLGISAVSNLTSVYLAYVLYFVLYDLCVVCVSVYAINFINLVLSALRLRALTGKQTKGKGQQKSQKGQQKRQQNDKQKSPQAEKKKAQNEKQAEKQKQQQQNGKIKNQEKQKQQQQQQQNGKVKVQQNDKQKSPKTPNSKKKN